MLVKLFTSFGWTRDDAKWVCGIVAAIVVGLAALGDGIKDYGIPLAALPYIRLGSLVVGLVSAKMATSGLPGKADATTVTTLKFPRS